MGETPGERAFSMTVKNRKLEGEQFRLDREGTSFGLGGDNGLYVR